MRVSLGGSITVAATDRWLSEIRAGRAFTDGSSVAAGGVGTFAEAQILNPVGSAVTGIIHAVFVSVQATSTLELRRHDTALAASDGTGINLLAGQPAGVVQFRQATPAAVDGTIIVPALVLAANSPTLLVWEWLFELGAGEGILVANSSANQSLQVWWQLIEV